MENNEHKLAKIGEFMKQIDIHLLILDMTRGYYFSQTLRILYRNHAILPEIMDGNDYFPNQPVVFSSRLFATTWNRICILPCAHMTVEEDPEPHAWGTAVSGMPVIHIPIIQYAAFMDALRKLNHRSFQISLLAI